MTELRIYRLTNTALMNDLTGRRFLIDYNYIGIMCFLMNDREPLHCKGLGQ